MKPTSMKSPMYLAVLNECSNNSKTGYIPVSMSASYTCPDGKLVNGARCPYMKACYAKVGHITMHWRDITRSRNGHPRKGISWNKFCEHVATLPYHQIWRHNAAGDLPGRGDVIDVNALLQLVAANHKAKAYGFTYTHKPVLKKDKISRSNAAAIYAANRSGFCIALSANSINEVDRLVDLGIGPVVTVLPIDAPKVQYTKKHRKVIVCPAERKNNITCATCKLCADASRTVVVGFRAHGCRKNAANDIATAEK